MHANLSPIRYFEMYILCCSNRICACPRGRSCLQVTPPSGLCFAGVLIHFRSGKFQALDMSYVSKGHVGFFREFCHDLCQNMYEISSAPDLCVEYPGSCLLSIFN